MLKIAVAAGITAMACFTISATTGLGASDRSGNVVNLARGDHVVMSAIGWSCDYTGSRSKIVLGCTTGTPGTASQGDPIVTLQRSRISVLGTSRPALKTLNTPKCCLRIWNFPTGVPGSSTKSESSDLDLAPGNSISVPGLDLLCRVFSSDPDHHDPGAVFACFRQSTTSSKSSTAAIEASRFHMRVSASGAKVWAYTVTRSP